MNNNQLPADWTKSWNFAKKMRTKDYEVAVKPAGLVNEPSEK